MVILTRVNVSGVNNFAAGPIRRVYHLVYFLGHSLVKVRLGRFKKV